MSTRKSLASLAAPVVRATAADVKAALRLKYPAGAFGFFEEVGNATGAGVARHADAVAVGLWPSRGLLIEGIEIKVSRSDWLSELKNPKKADAIAKYCDRWWLAVGDESLVQPGELPASWGLLVLRAGKMVCRIEAPMLEPEATPKSFKSFIAALLRRAHEGISRQVAAARREGVELGEKQGPQEHAEKVARLERAIAAHEKTIAEFEQAAGVRITQWDAGNVGKAVAELLAVRRYGIKREPIAELERAAERIEAEAKRTAESLRAEAQTMKAIAAAVGPEAAE